MKKIFFGLMLLLALSAQAVPAFPDLIIFRQPKDGKTVSIYLKGDEKVHWAESEDGYSLLHDNDGSFVFAMLNDEGDMIPSTYLAVDKEQRTPEVEAFLSKTPKHLVFSKRQVKSLTYIWEQIDNAKSGPKAMSEVRGEKKLLVILFEFNDNHFVHSKQEFVALMNQVNYTTLGRTGSVHDYYYDVSDGLFSLTMDVVGPFKGVYNTATYGDSDYGYQFFAREAVDSAAKYVNFSDYDNDGDGYIDGLHIIFAGYGEEAGAPSECIWSHKSYIYDPPTYNNTVVDLYSCSPECGGSSNAEITNIGVICHELGHVFGAPDYYDTDYGGSGGEFPGLGKWDIMSSGSWNCGGITPAHHNPYTKLYIYHWATCDTITGVPAQYVIDPVATNHNHFYRINTATPGDFFLIENRQSIKWDMCLPSHGMIVYHVHPDADGASVRNYRHPQQIYIITKNSSQYPNSTPSSYGQANSDLATFPGAQGTRDSLTDNSTPWFRPWSKQPNNIPLRNIAEDTRTGQIFFSVQDVSPDPLAVEAEGIDQDKILLTWRRYGNHRTLILMKNGNDNFPVPDSEIHNGDTLQDGSIVVYFNNSFSTVVPNLSQNETYHFKLFTQKNDGSFSDGITVDATTLTCPANEWRNEDFESYSDNTLPDCWVGLWHNATVDGQHALVSYRTGLNEDEWVSITSRPIVFGSNASRVLQYKVHFFDVCTETTLLKVEYQSGTDDDWVIIDTIKWNSDLDFWNERYIILPSSGDFSRLRFSVLVNRDERVAIDDIQIIDGWLVNSTTSTGGDIEPLGYTVANWDAPIEFIIKPQPGYEVHRLVYDGHVILPRRLTAHEDGTFSYSVTENKGLHSMHAAFKRNTGIEQTSESNVGIFPNPTTGMITVEAATGTLIKLYDTRGSLLMKTKTESDTHTINLNNLPKGIYIMQCETGDYGVQSIKVVKQ